MIEFCRFLSTLMDFGGFWCNTMAYALPWPMYYHGLCTTMVYVLPWSMYYHGLCTTMVYVLPWSMYYHCLCTTMIYVLPWSMCYHGLCTTMVYVLPWCSLRVTLGSLWLSLGGSLWGALARPWPCFGSLWDALGQYSLLDNM